MARIHYRIVALSSQAEIIIVKFFAFHLSVHSTLRLVVYGSRWMALDLEFNGAPLVVGGENRGGCRNSVSLVSAVASRCAQYLRRKDGQRRLQGTARPAPQTAIPT